VENGGAVEVTIPVRILYNLYGIEIKLMSSVTPKLLYLCIGRRPYTGNLAIIYNTLINF
jgi:hypothetical protein